MCHALLLYMGNAISGGGRKTAVAATTRSDPDAAMDALTRDVERLKAAMDERDRVVERLANTVDDVRVSTGFSLGVRKANSRLIDSSSV